MILILSIFIRSLARPGAYISKRYAPARCTNDARRLGTIHATPRAFLFFQHLLILSSIHGPILPRIYPLDKPLSAGLSFRSWTRKSSRRLARVLLRQSSQSNLLVVLIVRGNVHLIWLGMKSGCPRGLPTKKTRSQTNISLELCLACLRQRLNRPLTIDDFTDSPINDGVRVGFELGIECGTKGKQQKRLKETTERLMDRLDLADMLGE